MTNNKSADELAALFRRQRAEVERQVAKVTMAITDAEKWKQKYNSALADLARVTAERDAAKRALHLAIETHSVDQRQIERLAKYYMEQARGGEDGKAYWVDARCAGGGYRMTNDTRDQARLDRCAAYEDTGLEPEDIKNILDRYKVFRSAISDETGQPMVSWTRAGELCRADRDGRCVVLPQVSEQDRRGMADFLHDCFAEWTHDPSVGLYGMTDGEAALASAFMAALGGGGDE